MDSTLLQLDSLSGHLFKTDTGKTGHLELDQAFCNPFIWTDTTSVKTDTSVCPKGVTVNHFAGVNQQMT